MRQPCLKKKGVERESLIYAYAFVAAQIVKRGWEGTTMAAPDPIFTMAPLFL